VVFQPVIYVIHAADNGKSYWNRAGSGATPFRSPTSASMRR
jgi:hypothetical protein